MIRRSFLPYGRQTITEEDIGAVTDVLRSEWLTTGPAVEAFEEAFAAFTNTEHAVAVSSGTAALHAAVHAMNLQPGDEVIVPAITFAATANAVVYCGGRPIFADVDQTSLLLDEESVLQRITASTRGIIAVDYAGQPCDYDRLRQIAADRNLFLLADGCHALGANYKGENVGRLADATAFSFHPVKNITTGEGGMVTSNNAEIAQRMRLFRNHGITTNHRLRSAAGTFYYEMADLGFNYRLSDIQCALGLSQLRELPRWLEQRRRLARLYDESFDGHEGISPLAVLRDRVSAYHLYVIRIESHRDEIFHLLRERKIYTNVHYLPVYLHPYYRQKFGYGEGLCPIAEAVYQEVLSIPLFPLMGVEDVQYVAENVKALVRSELLGPRSAGRVL